MSFDPIVKLTMSTGNKRLSYTGWFHEFEIEDTGRVVGSTIVLTIPVLSAEGLPYEGYYEMHVYIECQEWDSSIPPARVPTYLPQTLEVKGSATSESYGMVDKSFHYSQGVGTNVSIYNNSLQGSAIILVEGDTCSARKVYIRFTGPQLSTNSVEISSGYVAIYYLGPEMGTTCS